MPGLERTNINNCFVSKWSTCRINICRQSAQCRVDIFATHAFLLCRFFCIFCLLYYNVVSTGRSCTSVSMICIIQFEPLWCCLIIIWSLGVFVCVALSLRVLGIVRVAFNHVSSRLSLFEIFFCISISMSFFYKFNVSSHCGCCLFSCVAFV